MDSTLTNILNDITSGLGFFIPELLLIGLFLLVIVVDLFGKNGEKQWLSYVVLLGLGFVAWFTVQQMIDIKVYNFESSVGKKYLEGISFFSGMVKLSQFSIVFKIIFLITGILTVRFAMFDKNQLTKKITGEYYALIIAILLGVNLMVMSSNLLMLYLAIETVSLSSYVLVAFRLGKKSNESALKYIVFGAVSSAIMLYGMSLVYGLTGSLSYDAIFTHIHHLFAKGVLWDISIVMVVCGLLFKVSAVPFHIWAPDVYEGTPLPVVSFFSVVPKLAGVVALVLFYVTFQFPETGKDWLPYEMGRVPDLFKYLIGGIAIVTMFVGNLSAIWQTNAKRLLAYSSIAHGGVLLLAVSVNTSTSHESIIYYSLVYMFANIGIFFAVFCLKNIVGTSDVSAFKGLGKKEPLLGIGVVVFVLSLAGLPPTAGFWGKLLVFSSLYETISFSADSWNFWLLVLGLFNTVIALFYYLKIPYLMFFKESENKIENRLSLNHKIYLILLLIPVILLFFKFDWIVSGI